MRRKIYDVLLNWKQNSNGKTALMLDGARRVGKSYIAEEFARREYDDYLLIDFSKVSRGVRALPMSPSRCGAVILTQCCPFRATMSA